jgi:hypothetical protein
MSDHETRIQVRRGTSSEWSNVNPVLAVGELGYDTVTGALKVGDGASEWNNLNAISGSSSIVSSSVVAEINNVSGQKNDWNLEGVLANFIKVNPSSSLTITGIDSSYAYKRFTILNDSTNVNITLVPLAGGSSAGMKLRFSEGVGTTIFPKEKVDFVYDNVDSEWLVLKHGVQSNTRPVINSYNNALVSGVYNIVIVDSATYSHMQTNNLTDPNTAYFVP